MLLCFKSGWIRWSISYSAVEKLVTSRSVWGKEVPEHNVDSVLLRKI